MIWLHVRTLHYNKYVLLLDFGDDIQLPALIDVEAPKPFVVLGLNVLFSNAPECRQRVYSIDIVALTNATQQTH
jgi:hypothetical protein